MKKVFSPNPFSKTLDTEVFWGEVWRGAFFQKRPSPRILFLKFCITLFFYSGQIFAEEAKTFPSIQNIVSESQEQFSLVNIFFSTPPTNTSPPIETYDGFIQVSLKDTITAEPGKFFDGNGPFIKKVSPFQVSPTESVVRIFSSPVNKNTKDAIETSITDNKMSIVLKNSLFQVSPPPTVGAAPSSTQENVSPFDLNTYLRRAGLFSLLFFLVILGFLSLKRFRRNQSIMTTKESLVEMKTLNHLHLSPKQKLTLVQVGKEQILLAISPENVSFISFIQKSNPIVVAPSPLLNPIKKDGPRIGSKRQASEKFLKGLKETMENHKRHDLPKVEEEAPQDNKKIHYTIDDSGITDKTKESNNAIDDITKLIREKLKALPKA